VVGLALLLAAAFDRLPLALGQRVHMNVAFVRSANVPDAASAQLTTQRTAEVNVNGLSVGHQTPFVCSSVYVVGLGGAGGEPGRRSGERTVAAR